MQIFRKNFKIKKDTSWYERNYMSNPSELTNQNIFISRLGDSVDDLYATEDAFTLMSIEVEAIDYRNGTKEVFGLLDKHIKRALVNQKDCYSFWNNTF